MEAFRTGDSSGFDVLHCVDIIGLDDLTLPGPSPDLRVLIERCHRPVRIGGGSQVLPLLLEDSFVKAARPLMEHGRDEIDVPLLRAPAVREKLEETIRRASDPSRISLLLHSLTVEIRDFESRTAMVYIARGLEGALSTPDAFYSLRKLFSLFLPALGAMMIHCAAVALDGHAVILAAPDSGGKTTASRLAPSGTVLGDDRNLIRAGSGCFDAFPTPWNTVSNHPADSAGMRVSGVFVLEKARSFGIRQTKPREAAAFLWEDNRSYFENLPATERDAALEMILELCGSVPCGVIGFPPDRFDWDRLAGFLGV